MESKEKINWRVDMNFYTANTQSKKERKEKERKKKKVISGQTMSNHYICAIRRWRGRQNESMIRQNHDYNHQSESHKLPK
jgi:hypothetical protein